MTGVTAADLTTDVDHLLSSYGEAIQAVSPAGVDPITRSLVVNVVVQSSRTARDKVIQRFPGDDAVARLGDYLTSLQKEDMIESALAGGRSLATLAVSHASQGVIVLSGLLAAGTAALVSLGSTSAAIGSEMGARNVIHLIVLVVCGGSLARGWKSASDTITSAFNIAQPARSILSRTIDQPERDLYARWGASPPTRPAVEAAGPIWAFGALAGIAAVTAIVGYVLVAAVLGSLFKV